MHKFFPFVLRWCTHFRHAECLPSSQSGQYICDVSPLVLPLLSLSLSTLNMSIVLVALISASIIYALLKFYRFTAKFPPGMINLQ